MIQLILELGINLKSFWGAVINDDLKVIIIEKIYKKAAKRKEEKWHEKEGWTVG